jgi:hypothetical protein
LKEGNFLEILLQFFKQNCSVSSGLTSGETTTKVLGVITQINIYTGSDLLTVLPASLIYTVEKKLTHNIIQP